MKQILLVVLLVACNKPSEDKCRKALVNIQQLMGTENLNEAGFEGEVRRCKGGSTKDAVDCAIKATTLDELGHCKFYKVPPVALGSATGSATGSTRSGSATNAGSAHGSGVAMTNGSAAGSMHGSAAGSDSAGSVGSAVPSSGSARAGSGSAK